MKTNSTKTIKSRKHTVNNCEPGRLTIYEALFTLNQEFEHVLEALHRLEQLRLFRKRLQREFLKTCGETIEETRAWANFELTHILRDVEERDWSRFGRLRRQLEGADDVPAEAERMQQAVGKKHRPQGRKAAGRT